MSYETSPPPYNPLDMPNIADSLAREMLSRDPEPIANIGTFSGAGIYSIYYTGDFPAYDLLAQANLGDKWEAPIYVGKADPPGGRKGIITGIVTSTPLFSRLKEHRESMKSANNLNVEDFYVRYLVTEPVFIKLGESLLINRFMPVWNSLLDGFGNHAPGKGRGAGKKPVWDTVHPGRAWAEELPPQVRPATEYEQEAMEYLRQRL
jgi:hypothetical protein